MLILVIGRRRQGKSTLGYDIACRKSTIVIFDPRKQFGTTDCVLPDAERLTEYLNEKPEIIIHPYHDPKLCFEEVSFKLDSWIQQNPGEPLAFLVDEARFIDTPEQEYVSFDRIIRFSNPQDVDVIMTCHRPVDISTDIRAIADYWCIFKTTLEHDLRIVRDRCGEQVTEIVAKLGPQEYVLWNDGDGTYAVKRDRAAWYHAIERKREVIAA